MVKKKKNKIICRTDRQDIQVGSPFKTKQDIQVGSPFKTNKTYRWGVLLRQNKTYRWESFKDKQDIKVGVLKRQTRHTGGESF